jgi:hypothetical protein
MGCIPIMCPYHPSWIGHIGIPGHAIAKMAHRANKSSSTRDRLIAMFIFPLSNWACLFGAGRPSPPDPRYDAGFD